MTHLLPDAALDLWTETAGGRTTLINLSENHTFRVDSAAGRFALRLHRPGYQSREGIESELVWLGVLRSELPVVHPIGGRDGALVQEVSPGRYAVLFAFEEGREPEASADLFADLGRFAATAHRQVERWQMPKTFTRPRWDAAKMLDANGLWGDWRQASHVAEVRSTLDAVDQRLRADLVAYGTDPDRFGLIHADMRLANLLVDGPRKILLDFDDCGFGWFVYDLAASLSFTEGDTEPLIASWLAGYRAVRPLTEEDLAMIEPMILLRRMVLLAWIGTHGETDLARAQAPSFAAETARFGEIYLAH